MDLSNKTLALILVVATSISLVGTILTIDRLSHVGSGFGGTGRLIDTDQGDANFSINSSVTVVFITNRADFGTGVVNGSGLHNCTLNTTGPGMLNGGNNPTGGPDCIGFNAAVQPLRIQNQGTQNVTLNISFNATGAQYIGGTTPELSFRASLNESGSCSGLATGFNAVTVQDANVTICPSTGFNWVSGARTLNIDLGLRIPQNAAPGERTVRATAFAYT